MNKEGNRVSIREAAKILGVSQETLRRWEDAGKISVTRTPKGHRRYDLMMLRNFGKYVPVDNNKTLAYARVSTQGQKDDLIRQVNLLETFCASKGWQYEVIEDLGSGINFNKKGLKNLINKILNREINRLVITNKDRLLRFGSELIFSICAANSVEVVIINKTEEKTFEEELVADVLEIITVFSAKLYGKRSHKTKKLIETLSKELNAQVL